MPPSDYTAREVQRAITVRADALGALARRLSGSLPPAREALRAALDLFAMFAHDMSAVAEAEFVRNQGSPQAQIAILTPLLRHASVAAEFVEEHLSHGTRRELSAALTDEISSALSELKVSSYSVVTSHGPADNFTTLFGPLAAFLYKPLQPTSQAPQPHAKTLYAFFRVPRLEGAGVLWRPVLLGHEVAHIAVHELKAVAQFGLQKKFPYRRIKGLTPPGLPASASETKRKRAIFGIAERWLTELLCDAYAVHRFGAAAVASIADYLFSVGRIDRLGTSHPPTDLRIRLLLSHVGTISDGRLRRVVRPFDDLVSTTPVYAEKWADELATFFLANSKAIMETVAKWPPLRYPVEDRFEAATAIADCLKEGIPGELVVECHGSTVAAVDADVVNAAWIAHAEDATSPVNSLGSKAIHSLEFARRWVASGGSIPLDLVARQGGTKGQLNASRAAERGLLSEEQLAKRLCDRSEHGLVVTPLLHRPGGASLDLRLGNKFIVFHRSSIEAFDPLDDGTDPQIMQGFVELGWSERFVLHPGELVLGATLEYLVLPPTLGAQVITRSSYGRLGLLSATAVQIHPYFHGCLTLELVNLGSIPITLTPGERVAQLVLTRTARGADPGVEKYVYAVGPEFSHVSADRDAQVLLAMRGS